MKYLIEAIRQKLCRHDWEIGKKQSSRPAFVNIRGEQIYRKCRKCGKIEPYIFVEYEGSGYK